MNISFHEITINPGKNGRLLYELDCGIGQLICWKAHAGIAIDGVTFDLSHRYPVGVHGIEWFNKQYPRTEFGTPLEVFELLIKDGQV